MPVRRAMLPCLITLAISVAAPVGATAQRPTPTPRADDIAVVVSGVGAAHGLGMAMDGVLGQARAGWKYPQILGLFYQGAKPTRVAQKNVRVGLAQGIDHGIELAGGGEVSDAPPGEPAGEGFPRRIPAGGAVVVGYSGGTYTVRASGVLRAAQQGILPITPPPLVTPSPAPSPSPTPSPSPSPEPTSDPAPDRVASSTRPIWVSPSGSPALMRLAATGRRYRGTMQLRYSASSHSLWAINHVDLETYVHGIAEEKGQGWPPEALKALAVAARTLAWSTTTWYVRNHADNYDICATDRCQVYLGYDGEEPAMTQACQATAGEIYAYQGRSLLAMYHGNGGGQTESYRLLYGDGKTDPYPYLSSVTYPFASPSHWQLTFAAGQVVPALEARGVAVPGRLVAVEVIQRGQSPRVRKVRVVGSSGAVETTGLTFQASLGLRSTWFDVTVGGPAPSHPDPIVPNAFADPLVPDPYSPDARVITSAVGSSPEQPPPVRSNARGPAVAAAVAAIALTAALYGRGVFARLRRA